MAHEFVAAFADFCRNLGGVVVNRRIHQVAHRQTGIGKQIEHPPNADPQAVIPPGIISDIRLGAGIGRRVAQALAEAEMFDVHREINGEAFAVRPVVIRPLDDRRIVVSVMLFQFHFRLQCSSAAPTFISLRPGV